MSVEVTVAYEGQLHCTATHGPSRQSLVTDAPLDNGGRGEAFSPTDLVATALGSCILTTVALVCQRHGLELTGSHIRVTKEMVSVPSRRIGALRSQLTIHSATPLEEGDRARIAAAANACPVHKSLHPDIEAPVEIVYG